MMMKMKMLMIMMMMNNDHDVDEGDAEPGSQIANPTLNGCDDYNDS